MRQYLGVFAAMCVMASAVAAHAEQPDHDPAKVSDSLKALYHFGSASTTKALNANTVTLLTGTIGGTYVQFGADLASVLDDDGNLRILPIIGRGSVQGAADVLFLKGVDLGFWLGRPSEKRTSNELSGDDVRQRGRSCRSGEVSRSGLAPGELRAPT